MKKIGFVILLALLLVGCGKTAEEVPQATVETTISPYVEIGGSQVLRETDTLDLTNTTYDMESILSAAAELPNVQTVELGCTALSAHEVAQLQNAFPTADVKYSVSLYGQNIPLDTVTLDMSAMTVGNSQELARVVGLLPMLQEINFVNSDGRCVYDLDTIPYLDLIREAAPHAKLKVWFDLFGKKVTSEDETIKYYRVNIGNEGAEQLRAVLPYLHSCTYFLLDGCGIDNEVLAQLRTDFPETKIVWRVWLCPADYYYVKNYSYLTDTELIRPGMNVRGSYCHVLQYCNETKYVDFGHNPFILDFSFLGYMPQLEVAIIAISNCNDLTPLANCPKLEYLEVFTTKVTDLSPLANCTELRHLNISNLAISDLSPLYGLKKLERLRIVMCDNITKEQIAEVAAQLPDCNLLTKGWDPTGNGWRKDSKGVLDPRYSLLRKQMQYNHSQY